MYFVIHDLRDGRVFLDQTGFLRAYEILEGKYKTRSEARRKHPGAIDVTREECSPGPRDEPE